MKPNSLTANVRTAVAEYVTNQFSESIALWTLYLAAYPAVWEAVAWSVCLATLPDGLMYCDSARWATLAVTTHGFSRMVFLALVFCVLLAVQQQCGTGDSKAVTRRVNGMFACSIARMLATACLDIYVFGREVFDERFSYMVLALATAAINLEVLAAFAAPWVEGEHPE